MEYTSIVEIGVEAVDWKSQGDEWLHRAGECMADIESYAITGHKYDLTTAPFIQVSNNVTDRGVGGTCFLVLPFDAGVLIATGTRGDEQPDESATEAWAHAAHCATQGLGSRGTEFEWTALLGAPSVRIGGSEVALDSTVDIGPFRIASAGQPLREMLPPQIPTLSSAGQSVSWPVLVEGTHEGYNWDAASKKAAFDLHRLSGLLTLAFGDCLVVRESPAPRDWGIRQVPEQIWWHKWPEGMDEEGRQSEPRNVKSVPDWVPDGWNRLVERVALGHAVDAHHEAMQAQLEHPTLSLVAYVASVEAMANLLFTAERCPECGAHRGVAARFRAALRLVADETTAEQLGKAYSPRSLTVHQGRLHGAETTRSSHGFIWSDSAREFEWGLWPMRKASGDLLRLGLRGQLPEKGALAGC